MVLNKVFSIFYLIDSQCDEDNGELGHKISNSVPGKLYPAVALSPSIKFTNENRETYQAPGTEYQETELRDSVTNISLQFNEERLPLLVLRQPLCFSNS